MADLPYDLVDKILSRVPAASLKRLRYTCKRWNTLYKDNEFTKKHFVRAPKQFLVLMLNENKVFSVRVNLDGVNENIAPPLIEPKGELGLINYPEHVDIYQMFHCSGLLLCKTEDDRLVVWNPCTGETKRIIPCNRLDKYPTFAFGYEENKSVRNYKILKYRSNSDLNGNLNNPTVEFEIYGFSSGSWRFLEITANFLLRSCGVSLKGNIYWLDYDTYLLCFDFLTEKLERLSVPFEYTYSCALALSVVKDKQLSVLHQRYDSLRIEIWVATCDKIDETIMLSWGKFLSMNYHSLSGRPWFSSTVTFFIDEEKKLVVCCDPARQGSNKDIVCVIGENGVYREIDFRESLYKLGRPRIQSYVPNLVQIQEKIKI